MRADLEGEAVVHIRRRVCPFLPRARHVLPAPRGVLPHRPGVHDRDPGRGHRAAAVLVFDEVGGQGEALLEHGDHLRGRRLRRLSRREPGLQLQVRTERRPRRRHRRHAHLARVPALLLHGDIHSAGESRRERVRHQLVHPDRRMGPGHQRAPDYCPGRVRDCPAHEHLPRALHRHRGLHAALDPARAERPQAHNPGRPEPVHLRGADPALPAGGAPDVPHLPLPVPPADQGEHLPLRHDAPAGRQHLLPAGHSDPVDGLPKLPLQAADRNYWPQPALHPAGRGLLGRGHGDPQLADDLQRAGDRRRRDARVPDRGVAGLHPPVEAAEERPRGHDHLPQQHKLGAGQGLPHGRQPALLPAPLLHDPV
mmetsp:Transcript_36101/g.103948  ORF Transcript_36101/g.103948 Transcript_36101/m.103948 type:complete len:367 (-) Transcript_36101:1405-2505(-)